MSLSKQQPLAVHNPEATTKRPAPVKQLSAMADREVDDQHASRGTMTKRFMAGLWKVGSAMIGSSDNKEGVIVKLREARKTDWMEVREPRARARRPTHRHTLRPAVHRF